MTTPPDISAELLQSLGELADGQLTDQGRDKLLGLLREDSDARMFYLDYMELHALLQWKDISSRPDNVVIADEAQETTDSEVFDSPSVDAPSLSTTHYSLPATFVGGPVFSYMVATVILCLLLMGAWAYKISHVRPSSSETAKIDRNIIPPAPVFVGRVTGMKDCRWIDENAGTMVGVSVPMGREYALSAGLMEITYSNGARVILEGPCAYKVDSDAGGYLARGKLTAKIRGHISENSSLIPHPSTFVVNTPTAIVTDLGTEFGVEVSENGDTISHVFQGVVEVQIAGDGKGKNIVLKATQSARVKKVENGARLTLKRETGVPPKFVRRLHEPLKQLDLLDIVAGGNGLGNRRERGIDPATGKQDTWFISSERQDDHGYHRVTWHELIDGVFVPYLPTCLPPAPQDVQVDSSGNTFGKFLEGKVVEGEYHYAPTIHGYTIGSIWSRAADMQSTGTKNGNGWIYSLIGDAKYMPEGRGLLGLHASVGITFDLAAMRKMYDGARPSRLRATVGMGDGPRKYPDAFGVADLWIFVDGRLEWVRKDIYHKDGAIDVDLSLGARDRFLTIVSTNGLSGKAYDWIVVGDPVLTMEPTQPEGH